MDITLYKIDGRNYKMFTLNIFGKPMKVASYALNRKIEKMIGQGRYHEVIDIDEQYGYYLFIWDSRTCDWNYRNGDLFQSRFE